MDRPEARLNVLLALLLGITGTIAFTSLDADGYPTAAVATGANPVVSVGGSLSGDATTILLTADEGMDIVVTDVVLSVTSNYLGYCTFSYVGSLVRSDGTKVAELGVGATSSAFNWAPHAQVIAAQLSSGILVPAGQHLELHSDRRYKYGCLTPLLHYTVSGYKAQP